jgi:endonuclease YncB( thermonuclease family)
MILTALLGVAIVAEGESFACTPVRVWDGDGPIWCAEGPRIRLSGIAAREIDDSCKGEQPCPKTSGPDARDALARLIGTITGRSSEGHLLIKGPTMRCVSVGGAGGSRTAAWCVSPKAGDVSCAAVKAGFALRWDRYWKGHKCR